MPPPSAPRGLTLAGAKNNLIKSRSKKTRRPQVAMEICYIWCDVGTYVYEKISTWKYRYATQLQNPIFDYHGSPYQYDINHPVLIYWGNLQMTPLHHPVTPSPFGTFWSHIRKRWLVPFCSDSTADSSQCLISAPPPWCLSLTSLCCVVVILLASEYACILQQHCR